MATIKRNIIVIAASAGGVDALCELTSNLPKNLDASIFVVMHVGGESSLAQILSQCGTLPAIPAKDDQPYRSGCIYCAPPNSHLSIKDHKTVLTRGPRENGHRPAADVLFRNAARVHREKVVGVVLSGGRDDGTAGLFTIKARGGVAIVQDPKDALMPNMPASALNMVDVDYCLPVRQIADVLVQLANGKANNVVKRSGETKIEEHVSSEEFTAEPPGQQIPVSCPECDGPLYAAKEGNLALYQCFVGHAYSPKSLTDEHTDALERALWTAIRKLKERIMLHQVLVDRKKRNKSEAELSKRLEESVGTAKKDIKLLRDVLDRI